MVKIITKKTLIIPILHESTDWTFAVIDNVYKNFSHSITVKSPLFLHNQSTDAPTIKLYYFDNNPLVNLRNFKNSITFKIEKVLINLLNKKFKIKEENCLIEER